METTPRSWRLPRRRPGMDSDLMPRDTSEQKSTSKTPISSKNLVASYADTVKERLRELPQTVVEVCPAESLYFESLEKTSDDVDKSVFRQQLAMFSASEALAQSSDENSYSNYALFRPPARSVNQQILRIHVYNTYNNQKTQNPELDSFGTTDMASVPPPCWTLRVQGRLLHPSQTMGFGGSMGGGASGFPRGLAGSSLRMTSFFDRIVVSRPSETVVWDRNSQVPQACLKASASSFYARGVAQQQAKLARLTEVGGLTTALEDSSRASSRLLEDASAACSFTLMDAAVSEGVTRQLVDCDGLELSRAGDEEETIEITFFPSFKVPLYSLSSELEGIVGTDVASLTQIVRAIWIRSRRLHLSAGSSNTSSCDKGPVTPMPSLKALPFDEPLRQALGLKNVETFNFFDLPQLIKPHCAPLGPITLRHTLKSGQATIFFKAFRDYIDNETLYDFEVNCPDTLFPLHNSLSSWLRNLQENKETICDTVVSKMNDATFTVQSDSNIVKPNDSLALPEDPSKSTLTGLLLNDSKSEVQQPNSDDDTPLSELDANSLWDALYAAVSRRNIYKAFSENPNDILRFLFEHDAEAFSETTDSFLDDDFLHERGPLPTNKDFFEKPWVPSAVQAYCTSRWQPFDDLVSRCLTLAGTERRSFSENLNNEVDLLQQNSLSGLTAGAAYEVRGSHVTTPELGSASFEASQSVPASRQHGLQHRGGLRQEPESLPLSVHSSTTPAAHQPSDFSAPVSNATRMPVFTQISRHHTHPYPPSTGGALSQSATPSLYDYAAAAAAAVGSPPGATTAPQLQSPGGFLMPSSGINPHYGSAAPYFNPYGMPLPQQHSQQPQLLQGGSPYNTLVHGGQHPQQHNPLVLACLTSSLGRPIGGGGNRHSMPTYNLPISSAVSAEGATGGNLQGTGSILPTTHTNHQPHHPHLTSMIDYRLQSANLVGGGSTMAYRHPLPSPTASSSTFLPAIATTPQQHAAGYMPSSHVVGPSQMSIQQRTTAPMSTGSTLTMPTVSSAPSSSSSSSNPGLPSDPLQALSSGLSQHPQSSQHSTQYATSSAHPTAVNSSGPVMTRTPSIAGSSLLQPLPTSFYAKPHHNTVLQKQQPQQQHVMDQDQQKLQQFGVPLMTQNVQRAGIASHSGTSPPSNSVGPRRITASGTTPLQPQPY